MTEDKKKKLFLLDAMALIYRAHFAFSKNPRITSAGINTSAVFGFANSLLEILYKENPTHIGVAFDTAAPTFRHESYEQYKANRQKQPEDIQIAIPYIKKLLACFQIPVIGIDGFEADDIVGTLAWKACKQGFEVYMVTMDKDYCQLVNDCVFLYKPSYMGGGHEVYDVPKVLEKFKIKRIDQVRDILGLMGDSVDNIPGIPGIGEKTAQKLIEEYDTIENLIANAEQLKGKLKENVLAYSAQGVLSKELATIHTEIEVIDFDENQFLYRGPLKDPFNLLCEELELRALKKRVLGNEEETKVKAPATETTQMSLFAKDEEAVAEEREAKVLHSIDTIPHDYHIMDTPERRKLLLESLLQQEEFCFDTETTGVDAFECYLVGISFSWNCNEGFYIPFSKDFYETQRILEEFKPAFLHKKIVKIGQNIKFDMLVLKKYGIEVVAPLFDTMLAHYLIEPDMRHNMDALAQIYLGYSCIPIEALIGKKGARQKSMCDIAVETVAEYAIEDADITLQLKTVFAPVLKETQTEKLFYDVEIPLIPVLAEMENTGINLNIAALNDYSKILQEETQITAQEIYRQAGQEFNIASPKQLGEILFDKLKLDDKAKKTKTKQYATGEEILAKLAMEHQIAKDILNYRELQKLKNTYVDALPLLISKKDGRIHTCYNQMVASTGRLSSTNPNLQNIPIKTNRGREIRKAFVPRDKEHLILSADYSQIELRIMAAFSKEKNMLEAFRQGRDIHTTTAAKVYGIEQEAVNGEMRSKAKMVNFGIIYGISAFGLSQRLGIPRKEAADIIDSYFREFPEIKSYMDESVNKAREFQYVETILGRRRYLRDINSRNITLRGFAERNAINAPIQGSAADLIKVAMINIHHWMNENKFRSKMLLQVHDELVFDVHKEEIEIIKKGVVDFMINAIPMEVPMEVGVGIGENWLEAH